MIRSEKKKVGQAKCGRVIFFIWWKKNKDLMFNSKAWGYFVNNTHLSRLPKGRIRFAAEEFRVKNIISRNCSSQQIWALIQIG